MYLIVWYYQCEMITLVQTFSSIEYSGLLIQFKISEI